MNDLTLFNVTAVEAIWSSAKDHSEMLMLLISTGSSEFKIDLFASTPGGKDVLKNLERGIRRELSSPGGD